MNSPDPPAETQPYRRMVGAILCGGRSSRFGSDKALAMAGGRTVGERILDAMRTGGADPVMAVGGTAGHSLGIPTIPDLRPGDGPLAGLITALLWAKSGPVLVVPCDLPLLEGGHVQQLCSSLEDHPGKIIVATLDGRPQVSLTIWPAEHGRGLLKLLDEGARSFRSALEVGEWHGVEVPAEALADADTPEELALLFGNRAG